jgi:hypothetical protein
MDALYQLHVWGMMNAKLQSMQRLIKVLRYSSSREYVPSAIEERGEDCRQPINRIIIQGECWGLVVDKISSDWIQRPVQVWIEES